MWPAFIAAGATLAGGLLNQESSSQARESNEKIAARQEQLQREFAQSGIQWRVEDAKKAGIHPLYALGASTPGYSPSGISVMPDTSMGNALSAAGQDVSRALAATQTPHQKALETLQIQAQNAAISKDEAQAAYYWSLAARSGQSDQTGPGIPGVSIQPIQATHIVGQNLDPIPTGLIKGKAHEVTSTRTGDPARAAGRNPGLEDYSLGTTRDGRRLVITAPRNEEGWTEGIESAGLHALPMIIRESAKASGMSVGSWVGRYLLGNEFVDDWADWRRANHQRNLARQPR